MALKRFCFRAAVPVGLALSPSLLAAPSDNSHMVVEAFSTTEEITLDGELTEEAWQRATPANNFIQGQPNTGAAATEQTEIRILYDKENLYFGVVCFESEMDKRNRHFLAAGFLDWTERPRWNHYRYLQRSTEFLRLCRQSRRRQGGRSIPSRRTKYQLRLGFHFFRRDQALPRPLDSRVRPFPSNHFAFQIQTSKSGESTSSGVCAEKVKTVSGRPYPIESIWAGCLWQEN